MKTLYKNVHEKFFVKVKKTKNCWLWKARIGVKGYGYFGHKIDGKDKCVLAHRFSFELLKEKIPKDMTLHHLCEVKRCVNPDHLVIMTNKDNILLGNCISAINARKTHCIRGHEFNEINTRYGKTKSGISRRCRVCQRIRKK